MLLWLWIGFGLATGLIAQAKGRNIFYWTFFGLLGPIIGMVAILIAKPERKVLERRAIKSGDQRKCPNCAELVLWEARVCKHCHQPLPVREGFAQANFTDDDDRRPIVQPIDRAKPVSRPPNW